ncbi:MAG: S-DNA-T family DNA segregation ATPase FtsK/SpoIIIE [Vicingaceae bacterium]|jgi:S-DNA-T family DNA segregation ATPase FtsK/SpoIIIE
MTQNRFKSDTPEEKSSKKKDTKTNKAKNPLSGERRSIAKYTDFLKTEKTKQIVGISLILSAAALLLAFTSFLFTWKSDQSKVELPFWDYFTDSNIAAENWLGKIGAALSHQFIYNWFGIASFLFVVIFFIVGFRVLFKVSLLPIFKTIKYSLFGLIWFSLFFGYFFNEDLFYLGGAVGYELNLFLGSVLGKIGAGIFVFFLLSVFIISVFDIKTFFANFKNDVDQIKNEENEKLYDLNTEKTIDELHDEAEGEIALEDIPKPFITSETIEEIPVKEEHTLEVEEDIAAPEVEKIEEDKFPLEVTAPIEEVAAPAIAEANTGAVELTTEVTEELNEIPEEVSLEIEEGKEKDEILSDKEVNKKLEDYGEYDPTLDLSEYKMPGIDLLDDHGDGKIKVDKEELEANKNRIVNTLENYNIKIQSIKATIGPTVTLYEIVPAPGVRISKIKNLEDDIALSLAALGIRIIAPIPGKGTIGIEVPNQNPDVVSMRTVIASEKFQNADYDLPVVMGKTISNEVFAFDLAKMPHLLMAGATGQGKSVGLNAVLTSLLYKKHPSQLKFVLVDPKKVELTLFNKIERHFLAKLPDSEDAIITDNQKVIHTLNSLCIEMDDRYELLKNAFVRNIKEYNAKFVARKLNPENGHKYLPYIVLVIDEFADLIMTAGKEVETPIARLAQLARAIGIHLIIATQRPSTNIITGSIKANFPARIAFRVTTGIDSRTILDSGGAEQLIGRGDMLLSTGSDLVRLQCAFVDTPEVEKLTEFIGSQRAYPDAFLLPEYIDENSTAIGDVDKSDRDVLFEDAARLIVQHQQGSASLLQRKLKLGYNRAGRIVDQLEAAGIIGQFEGSKARQVLITDEMSLEQLLNNE